MADSASGSHENIENNRQPTDRPLGELEEIENKTKECEASQEGYSEHSQSKNNPQCSQTTGTDGGQEARTQVPSDSTSKHDSSKETERMAFESHIDVQNADLRCQDAAGNDDKQTDKICTGEDWDLEIEMEKKMKSNDSHIANQPSNSNEFKGTKDWDLEIKISGITPPNFILKKEHAKDDYVDFDKVEKFLCDNTVKSSTTMPQSDLDSHTDGTGLEGAVGGLPSTSSAIMQLPSEHGSQSLYHIKWIKWKNLNTPIVTQNENGPCPLIALMNVLILQRKISIPSMQEIVSASQLMEYLGDCILDHAPQKLTEGARLNYEQNMADAITIMCKLQTGLDVNVKFTGVADFEFTPECVVFDLLNIRLVHGWLVDPQNHEAVVAIGTLSYNQLVEKIIASKQDGANPELVTEGLVAESFLDHSASQLTYHGLYELNAKMDEEELCIFFRNNHFNTLFKHKNELFQLVTDQGYLTEDKVMWETLSNVEGDGYFVDANLQTIPGSNAQARPTGPADKLPCGISQEDQDYLVALSLQEEQSANLQPQQTWDQQATTTASSVPPQTDPSSEMTTQEWSDLQLALQLQEEEQRSQQQRQQQSPRSPGGLPGPPPSNPSTTSQSPRQPSNPQPQQQQQQGGSQQNKDCTIL